MTKLADVQRPDLLDSKDHLILVARDHPRSWNSHFDRVGPPLIYATKRLIGSTPPGVGWKANPRRVLKQDDEFRVFVSHGVGTLINKIEEEK
jgi:hypothetical protein